VLLYCAGESVPVLLMAAVLCSFCVEFTSCVADVPGIGGTTTASSFPSSLADLCTSWLPQQQRLRGIAAAVQGGLQQVLHGSIRPHCGPRDCCDPPVLMFNARRYWQ
jgi:hypothetical protein